MSLVHELADRVGPRPAGSPAGAVAADAVAEALREAGLEPRFQEFPLLAYEAGEPELEVDGARWAAGPCMYAHPTPEGGVRGRVRHIGGQPRELAGGEDAPAFAIEDDQGREVGRIYANPVVGGPIPFLSLQHLPITVGPTVYVSVADGERLRELEGAAASLIVRGRFVPGRTERNVLAELAGESPETVVVSAHYDGVWRSPAAVDNASGVEALRRVAERLAGRRHPRTLLVAAFAAEEIGLVGSRYFVHEAKLRRELTRIVGNVNLDCVAHGDKLELMVAPEELRGRTLELVARLGLDDRYDLRVDGATEGTDHFHFAQQGVPAVSILHFPYPEYHLPDDVPALVDERKLEDVVELAAALVESQLRRPVPRP
jgi:hypothetical protein